MSTIVVGKGVSSSTKGGSTIDSKDMARLRVAYKRFNDRTKVFLSDMDTVYGKQYPGLGDAKRQMHTFTMTDPGRMQIAHLAWPHFNKHRALIDKRDTEVLIKHDIGGLQAKAKVDVAAFLKKMPAQNKEAIWRAIEDLLDLLDEINGIRPIPVENDDNDEDQKKSQHASTWHEGLDILVPVSSLETVHEEEPAKQDSAKESSAGNKASAEWAKHLMSNLKEIIGGDASVDDDFEQLMNRLNDGDDGKTTSQDHDTMTRILHHFIAKIVPSGNEDEDEPPGMSEAEREAWRSKRQIQEIAMQGKIKYVFGKLTQIEAFQNICDPSILEEEKRETAEEEERKQHPEQNREYTITAHFNHKTLLVLNKLHKHRGHLKTKKDGRIAFPGIKNSFASLLAIFKENPGTENVIRQIGDWVVKNRDKLLARDDSLFLEPDHPYLVEMNSAALWKTFKPHERDNFWSLVGHPLQLATIFHHLDCDELRSIADIVNDLLAAGKIAYDRDPKTLNSKQVITKAIERGVTKHKIGAIRGLFERMQKEKDHRTLKALAKLMQDVLPQAAGLRSGGRKHNEEDPELEQQLAAEAKATQDRAQQFQNTFTKLLANMPDIPFDTPTKPNKSTSKPTIPTAAATTAAATVASSKSAPVDTLTPPTPPSTNLSAPPNLSMN